jgi:FkbM family methyltransferase
MTSKLLGWARSALAPRERLLPGLGVRLAAHPRLAVATLVALRRVPGAGRNVSRPLIQRMATRLLLPVSGGFRISVDTSEAMGRVLVATGVWEPHVTAVFKRLLLPGDVCVDVGANTGYFTLLAAKLVGPTGRVYALEPAPDTFAALLANLDLNGCSNAIPLQVAAGDAQGEVLFDDQPRGMGIRSRVRPEGTDGGSGTMVRVPVRDIPSLLDDEAIDRLRLVKIDVEGYEVEVLRGLETLFDTGARPAVLIEIHLEVVRPALELLVRLSRSHELSLYDLRVGQAPVDVSGHSPDQLAAALEQANERHLIMTPGL